MTTRMMHPEHGWTHAYDASEVESLKAQGWIVEPEKKPEPEPKRKPGRPAKAK